LLQCFGNFPIDFDYWTGDLAAIRKKLSQ